MKKINSVVSLSFLPLFLLVSTVIGSEDWVIYNRDTNGDVSYYDQNSVKRTTSGIVSVWTTKIYSKNSETKRKIQDIFIRLSRDGGEKIHSSKMFWEINCKKDMWRLMSYTYYDVNGSVLYLPSVFSDWDYIIPGSDMDILKKIVCK